MGFIVEKKPPMDMGRDFVKPKLRTWWIIVAFECFFCFFLYWSKGGWWPAFWAAGFLYAIAIHFVLFKMIVPYAEKKVKGENKKQGLIFAFFYLTSLSLPVCVTFLHDDKCKWFNRGFWLGFPLVILFFMKQFTQPERDGLKDEKKDSL